MKDYVIIQNITIYNKIKFKVKIPEPDNIIFQNGKKVNKNCIVFF